MATWFGDLWGKGKEEGPGEEEAPPEEEQPDDDDVTIRGWGEGPSQGGLTPFRNPATEGADRRSLTRGGRPQDVRTIEDLLEKFVCHHKVARQYGGKYAPYANKLIDKVKLRKGRPGLESVDGKRFVVNTKDRKGLTLSKEANDWIANSKLLTDVRTEYENRSDEGRAERTLYQMDVLRKPRAPTREAPVSQPRVDELTRGSIREITEEVRTEVEERSLEMRENIKEYVKVNLEGYYKAVNHDLGQLGELIRGIGATTPQEIQPFVDVN